MSDDFYCGGYILSQGALKQIYRGHSVAKDCLILQVLNFRKFSKTSDYQLLLTDGVDIHQHCMVDCQRSKSIVDLIASGKLEKYSIIKLEKYERVEFSEKGYEKTLIFPIELQILKSGSQVGRRLGQALPSRALPRWLTLTRGAINKVLDNIPLESDPILQVLDYKQPSCDKMHATSKMLGRFRLLVSDGSQILQNCIVTNEDIIDRMCEGQFEKFSIIKLTNFNVLKVKELGSFVRKFINILEMEVLAYGHSIGCKLGNPCPLLTKGAIDWIVRDGYVFEPVVQMLSCKQLVLNDYQSEDDQLHEDRIISYRLKISDGVTLFHNCIVASKDITDLIESGDLDKYAIIKLCHFSTDKDHRDSFHSSLTNTANHSVSDNYPINSTTVLYPIQIKVLKPGSEIGRRLGHPTSSKPIDIEKFDSPTKESEDKNSIYSKECMICCRQKIDSVIYSCGHMCTCFECGTKVKEEGLHCPICRAYIIDVIKTFWP